MKRYLLVLLLPLFTLCANAADTVEIEGIYYDIYYGTATVTSGPTWDWYSGDIVIPETITHEGWPQEVNTIGKEAFRGCEIHSITIPNSVTLIGEKAFRACTLTSVVIPNSVFDIDTGAFEMCYSLESITLPNSLLFIADSLFRWCNSLTSITIPNNVTSIGDNAFESCFNLTSITIPDGVTSIGDNAFESCFNLTSITIPDGVTSIGANAFNGCSNVKDFYCFAKKIPIAYEDTFGNHQNIHLWTKSATLHVPEESLDAYKATAPWNLFGNIVGDATGITRIHNDPVQVHHDNGHITVEGVEEGTAVSVYDIKGVQIGSAIVEGGKVFIPTNLQTGNIAIVKIKDKSIKVTIK